MADLSFDVVIVGGGCKALPTAIYLAKFGGMSVGVFEATHELGGGIAGDQVLLGFQGNQHSWAQNDWYWNIVIKDDLPELWEEGFKSVGRMSGMVNLFPDDTCLTIYGFETDPDGTRGAEQIARFSQKDADTWMKIRELYLKHVRPAFYEEMFSLPTPPGEMSPIMKALSTNEEIKKMGFGPHLAAMSPIQGLKLYYESEQLMVSLLRKNQTSGLLCDDGATALPVIMNSIEGFTHAMIEGGTHNLTHAAHRTLYKYGGKVYTHSEVEKVIIENGSAKGIKLADGTEIEAKKAVISTLSPHQLCYDLIGKEYLNPAILKKIDALETDRVCITWYNWALTEYPKFKAHDFNPDIDSDEMFSGLTFYTMGAQDIMSIVKENAYRKMHVMPPDPLIVFMTAPPSARLTGNPNHCVALSETYVPPADAYPEDWWLKFQQEHADWQMAEYQKYMTNMGWDKVQGISPVTPYYTAKHFKNMAPSGNWQIIDFIASQRGYFRPIPEPSHHRTPVKDLYATGTGWGNWGASSLCAAYTCYKVMADDYGLRKPWEEQGRSY